MKPIEYKYNNKSAICGECGGLGRWCICVQKRNAHRQMCDREALSNLREPEQIITKFEVEEQVDFAMNSFQLPQLTAIIYLS